MFLWELLSLNAANSVNFKIQRYIIFILCIKFKCCNISDLYIYNEILVHTTFIIIMSFLWQYYAVFKICVLLINLHIFSVIIDCFQKVTHHEIVKINIWDRGLYFALQLMLFIIIFFQIWLWKLMSVNYMYIPYACCTRFLYIQILAWFVCFEFS